MGSLKTEVFQDFRVLFVYGNEFVASATVLRNRISRLRDMLSIMTAETTGEPLVTGIVWITAPGDAHPLKDVLRKNRLDRGWLLLHVRLSLQRCHRIAPRKR